MNNTGYVMNVMKGLVGTYQMRAEDYKDFGSEIAKRLDKKMSRLDMVYTTQSEWRGLVNKELDGILCEVAAKETAA